MKALVTGGAGFIGSHLVESLLEKGWEVRVLDNFATGHRDNIKHLINQIDLLEGDVTNLTTVRFATRNIDVIFHEAALPSVPRSVKNPLESNEVNLTGTLNVLLAARDNNVKRVIYAASSSAYGDQPTSPKVETMAPAPMSPYAIGKYAGEMYAQAFTRLYGLSTVSLRYFNVFGPRQDPATQYAGVIAKFINRALTQQPFPIDGDGEQSRDFTYVQNAVDANLLAASAQIDGAPVINVAFGQRTTINQITAILNELTQQNLACTHGAARQGDVRHSHADISVARKLLGYDPKIDVRQGLERTLEWYKNK